MAGRINPSRMACREPLDIARDGRRRTACHEQSRMACHEQSRMACREQSRTACVVALLSAGAADRLSMSLVRVGSGYEAAAELLSGPASALLVDLSILTPAHAGLLKLAAGLDVPIVAFGTVSAALDGEALAGVRLVGAEEVPEALREVMTVKPTSELPTGQFVAEEPPTPMQFDDAHRRQFDDAHYRQFDAAHRRQFDKPLTKDELDALLRD